MTTSGVVARARTTVLATLVCAIHVALPPVTSAQDNPFGKHTYEHTVRTADWLSSMQPATTWETPAHGEAADFLEFISDNRLLVGVIDVNRHAAPGHSKLYLVDANTGSLLWEYERDNLSGGSYSLLLTEPHLLLLGADSRSARFDALDQASGREVWDLKVDAPYSVAIALEQQRLLVLFRDGSRWKLRAVDIERGKQAWELSLDESLATKSTPASVTVAAGSAYVLGRAIVEVSIADGSVTRTIDAAPLAADGGTALSLEDGMLAWDAGSVSYVDRASGTARWTSTADAPIQSVVVAGGHIVQASGEDVEHTVLSLLDPASGRARWTYEVAGPVLSPLASDAGLLLFTTDSALVGIDTTEGHAAFVSDFPDEMAAGSPSHAEMMGLPDVLRSEAGRLFVSRERAGLSAFDVPTGTLDWYQRHYDANLPALNYTADGRYAYVYQTLFATGRMEAGGQVTPPASLAAVNRSTSSSPLLATAQRDYSAARSRYDALQRDPSPTAGERRGAVEGVRLAAEGQLAATNMDIAIGRFNAGMGLVNSLVGLADAVGQMVQRKGQQGLIDRAQLSMQGAMLAQHRLFQSGRYLRPFYLVGRGRGVTVVQTVSGRRRDLIFSPHSAPSIGYGLDMPTFAVSPAGDRLVAFGISLHSERYERRGKWNTHLPNYSILSYDLDNLKFVDHATVFASVIDAVVASDSTLVAWLLERGGDASERRALWFGRAAVSPTHPHPHPV